jgi:hypothetical protein
MYQINIIKKGINPTTGRPQYRVINCFETFPYDVYLGENGIGKHAFYFNKEISILSEKPRKVGTIINPNKAFYRKAQK